MRYSKRMKRRRGRSSKSLTYRFPSSMQSWPPILRTLLLSFTSFGRLPDRSCRRTITCIPTGIRPPYSTTSLLPSWGGEVRFQQQHCLYPSLKSIDIVPTLESYPGRRTHWVPLAHALNLNYPYNWAFTDVSESALNRHNYQCANDSTTVWMKIPERTKMMIPSSSFCHRSTIISPSSSAIFEYMLKRGPELSSKRYPSLDDRRRCRSPTRVDLVSNAQR